jgi:hypothetical protein
MDVAEFDGWLSKIARVDYSGACDALESARQGVAGLAGLPKGQAPGYTLHATGALKRASPPNSASSVAPGVDRRMTLRRLRKNRPKRSMKTANASAIASIRDFGQTSSGHTVVMRRFSCVISHSHLLESVKAHRFYALGGQQHDLRRQTCLCGLFRFVPIRHDGAERLTVAPRPIREIEIAARSTSLSSGKRRWSGAWRRLQGPSTLSAADGSARDTRWSAPFRRCLTRHSRWVATGAGS